MLVADSLNVLFGIAIPGIGSYRAAQMRRVFIDPVYRNKASWSAVLMAAIVLSNVSSLLPNQTTFAGALLSFLPFLAIILIAFLFVDSTVLVAERTDFFHRDIFSWSRARLPAGLILALSLAVTLTVSVVVPNPVSIPLWFEIFEFQFVPVSVVVMGYGSLALAVSARRTADKTLKRHITLLGTSLAMFVVLVATFLAPQGDVLEVAIDILSVGSLYVLYLAVMSLTPLGKVERRAA